nr:hypothetical protein [Candidatus Paceibacterota bacterium]HMP19305.1 hypothetical protein [Candidatus Paceibacterota bacterium]
MEKQEGGFMKGKYWSSPEFRNATEKQAQRTEIRTGENIPNNPEEKIENYLKRFTDIFDREDLKDREHGIQAIIKLLHKKYLIKPENISDEYIKGVVFGNYAEQKGYNTEQQRDPDTRRSLLEQFKKEFNKDFDSYNVPKDQREKVIESAIKDQTQRMDSWFSYLTGPEAKNYPVAYRYWAFAEMLKLGSYDDDRQTYNKRTEDTAASFPELDQQALAIVLDEINKKQKNNQSNLIIEDEQKQQEFKKRLQSENFGKLYAFVQEHLKTLRLPEERLLITKGEWKTFPKGSDAMRVVKILEGFHTKWCISGYGTAESYLSHSDLHIYLSEDEKGNYSIPRACIVNSEQNGITEVRGIMSDENSKQHLDSYITPIVSEKLKTIPTGEKWQEKMSDMKKLATIYIKFRQREGLNTDELRFVYELDKPIQSTGYGQDTRIAEILNGRDIIADM